MEAFYVLNESFELVIQTPIRENRPYRSEHPAHPKMPCTARPIHRYDPADMKPKANVCSEVRDANPAPLC